MNRILILLVTAVGINYIDRGLLSVSAPLIQAQLGLSPTQLGVLFSAFFWTYASVQVVAGWVVDRYPLKWVYAIGYLLWSIATAVTGLVEGFGQLLGARLVLGVGESVAYPATSKILVREFPESRRGFANAVVDAGAKIGPGLSTLAGGLMVSQYGWRALFLGVGVASLLWLIPWLMYAHGGQERAEARQGASPTMMELLLRREAWGTYLGMFALGYVWYFLLSWLPSYLVKERGFSMQTMAVLGSVPFWGMAVATLAGGWASDARIRAGGNPTRVRKTFLVGGLLLCGATMLPAVLVSDARWSVGWLTAACLSLGIYTSNVWAVTQTLAGPVAAGRWSGIQNAIGNLGGVVSPVVTGWIVSVTGSFVLAFVGASVVLLGGAACYLFLLGEVKGVDWGKR
ncbi:MAG: MFS transporter [Bryobacteraceae bacterium]